MHLQNNSIFLYVQCLYARRRKTILLRLNGTYVNFSNLFQECEGSLNHKTELVAKLEAKMQSMTDTMQTLETK